MTALLATTLPASGASFDNVVREQSGRQITAEPRSGARSVTLSTAQRRKLLEAATDARATTARSLKLSDREELIPKDVVKDADGTVHTRYERTYAVLPVVGGDLVVHEQGAARTVTKAVVTLVSENGTEIPVKNWYWDIGEGELHTTYTVDASAVPANGTWKLRVQDNTPGIFTVDPGYLDSWSLTF